MWSTNRPSVGPAGIALAPSHEWRNPRSGPAGDEARRAPAEPADALDAAIDFHARAATERLLACARLVAGVAFFAALASGSGGLHPSAARLVIGGYAWFAAVLLVVTWTRPAWAVRAGRRLHVLDLTSISCATALSGGASSHVFPLFTFVLVSAAYRWGLRRTLLEASLIVIIAMTQSVLALAGLTPWSFEFDWFVIWAAYLVVLAVLFGVLSERQPASTFHAAAVGRVLTCVTRAAGLGTAIPSALDETLRLFGARDVRLVIEDTDADRLFCWGTDSRRGQVASTGPRGLPAIERDAWLVPLPYEVTTFEVRRGRHGNHDRPAAVALDADGRLVDATVLARAFPMDAWPCVSLLGVVVSSRAGWNGRLYLLDPALRMGTTLRLGLLQQLVARVAPALLELYLLHGMRARAVARERARVSRELHDGVIQSLVGIEMRLECLRRRAGSVAPLLEPEVTSARDVLHEQAVAVRELMEHLRPVDLDAGRLPAALGTLVEHSVRDAGIEGRLLWSANNRDLSPRQCREVYRVVQEALVNVCRHSRASRVDVRIASVDSGWRLSIEDNGKGLGFTGRMTHETLAAQQKGPRVIRERAAVLGGELTVESSSTGTRIDIAFPDALPVQHHGYSPHRHG
jgi:signal transduction histidine kinase